MSLFVRLEFGKGVVEVVDVVDSFWRSPAFPICVNFPHHCSRYRLFLFLSHVFFCRLPPSLSDVCLFLHLCLCLSICIYLSVSPPVCLCVCRPWLVYLSLSDADTAPVACTTVRLAPTAPISPADGQNNSLHF